MNKETIQLGTGQQQSAEELLPWFSGQTVDYASDGSRRVNAATSALWQNRDVVEVTGTYGATPHASHVPNGVTTLGRLAAL